MAVERPTQLAMLGGRERPVGALIPSVIAGTNADLVAAVAPLYLTGSVLDVTYGRGVWWRHFTPRRFTGHDLSDDGVDFRELPYDASSWDTVCFDPPYVPRQGGSTTNPRHAHFRRRYGIDVPRSRAEMEVLIRQGLEECARVARRWVLVKACDYVNGKQFHAGHAKVITWAGEVGLREYDVIVHLGGTGPGGDQITRMQRTRRAHSYLLVFSKRRLGRKMGAR